MMVGGRDDGLRDKQKKKPVIKSHAPWHGPQLKKFSLHNYQTHLFSMTTVSLSSWPSYELDFASLTLWTRLRVVQWV